MKAIPTMISFSVMKNHELNTHFAIAVGRGGQLKSGETCSGTLGVWFQPLSGASDMMDLVKMAILIQWHGLHHLKNGIIR
jgi:hypothetical protein